MSLLPAIFRWIARYAFLFVLLVAAMAIYGQYRQSAASSRTLSASIVRLGAARADIAADIAILEKSAVTSLDKVERISLRAIDNRIRVATARRNVLASQPLRIVNLITAPRTVIAATVRRDLEFEVLDQEIAFLKQLRRNVETRGRAFTLDARIVDLDRRIAEDMARIAALPSRLLPGRYVRVGIQLRDLGDVYAERRLANMAARRTLVSGRTRLGDIRTLVTPNAVGLARRLAPLDTAIATQSRILEASVEREAQRWYVKLGIADILPRAGLALLLVILSPYAIRTLFYWVLAPLASLHKPVQLLGSAAPIPLPTQRSAVSRRILLTPGTELLIRQGFEQTVSLGGSKATQWFLNARFPISSLVSGLYFLTRIRGQSGDTVTVSAIRDPFAEVAILTLPVGAAAVLQPRAIAGVKQMIASPLRITSHWRLGTLHAWLTWQWRYLVFHGPAEIILTGRRGVRIEPALAGRSIGQDQLIGFSTGIGYSTGRTETFIPYLIGREPLLKDRIAAGSGVLIAEEAPLSNRGGIGARNGLEGVADAVLKLFGL